MNSYSSTLKIKYCIPVRYASFAYRFASVRHESEKLCYTEDEGRPLGAAMQVEASNHLKRLWSKAMVVSVKEEVFL